MARARLVVAVAGWGLGLAILSLSGRWPLYSTPNLLLSYPGLLAFYLGLVAAGLACVRWVRSFFAPASPPVARTSGGDG